MVDFILTEAGDFLLQENGDKIILDISVPIYQVNNGTEFPGIFADWSRVIKRVNTDKTIDYQPHARHFWRIPQMSAADFEELQALQGSALTELKTNDIDLRNMPTTYVSAVMRLVNGKHIGTRVLDVNVEFRVDVE